MKKKNTKSPLIGKKERFKTEGNPIVCCICEKGGGTLIKIGAGEYAHPYCFNKKIEKREEKNVDN